MYKLHSRGLLVAAAALSLALTASPAAWTAEPTIRVQDSDAAESYQAYIDRLAAEIIDAATLAGQDGPAIYFDPALSLDQVAGYESLSLADQALLRAGKRTYDLFRALGGAAVDQFAVIQRQGDRIYIGFDGEGGRWLATPQEAFSYMLAQLVHNSNLPQEVKDAVAQCPYHFQCLLLASYTGLVEIMASVPRGTDRKSVV